MIMVRIIDDKLFINKILKMDEVEYSCSQLYPDLGHDLYFHVPKKEGEYLDHYKNKYTLHSSGLVMVLFA